jgi:hypothetical protein
MNLVQKFFLLALLLFFALLAAQFAGRWIGQRRIRRYGKSENRAAGAVEGAVFALLGLLIAFTFTSAAGQYDDRRDLIAQHVNALGTAWLRLDLLPDLDEGAIRDGFRAYLDLVIALPQAPNDPARLAQMTTEMDRVQGEVWQLAVAAANRDGRPQIATLVLPSLNEVFDLTDLRIKNADMHIHPSVFVLLIGLALLAAMLAGNGQADMAPPGVLHMVIFALLLALTLYFILDFEYPRMGLIRLDASDQFLIRLRAGMG